MTVDKNHFLKFNRCLPLTLALSLGEREQPSALADFSNDHPANPALESS
jgi:hypothetical protein